MRMKVTEVSTRRSCTGCGKISH